MCGPNEEGREGWSELVRFRSEWRVSAPSVTVVYKEEKAHLDVDAALAPGGQGAAVEASLRRFIVKVSVSEPVSAVVDAKQAEEEVADHGRRLVEADSESVLERVVCRNDGERLDDSRVRLAVLDGKGELVLIVRPGQFDDVVPFLLRVARSAVRCRGLTRGCPASDPGGGGVIRISRPLNVRCDALGGIVGVVGDWSEERKGDPSDCEHCQRGDGQRRKATGLRIWHATNRRRRHRGGTQQGQAETSRSSSSPFQKCGLRLSCVWYRSKGGP